MYAACSFRTIWGTAVTGTCADRAGFHTGTTENGIAVALGAVVCLGIAPLCICTPRMHCSAAVAAETFRSDLGPSAQCAHGSGVLGAV